MELEKFSGNENITTEDCFELAKLHNEIKELSPVALSIEAVKSWIQDMYREPNIVESAAILAREDDKIIGYGNFVQIPQIGLFGIEELSVAPEFRKNPKLRVGSTILGALEQEARAHTNVSQIGLTTSSEAARRFYEKMGYQNRGHVKNGADIHYVFTKDLLEAEK